MIGYAFACLPPLLCVGLPLRYLLRSSGDASARCSSSLWPARCVPARTSSARGCCSGSTASRCRCRPPTAASSTACGRRADAAAARCAAAARRCCCTRTRWCSTTWRTGRVLPRCARRVGAGRHVLGLPRPGGGLHRPRRVPASPWPPTGATVPSELSLYLDAGGGARLRARALAGGAHARARRLDGRRRRVGEIGLRHPGLKVTVDQGAARRSTTSRSTSAAASATRAEGAALAPRAPSAAPSPRSSGSPAGSSSAVTFTTGRRKRGGSFSAGHDDRRRRRERRRRRRLAARRPGVDGERERGDALVVREALWDTAVQAATSAARSTEAGDNVAKAAAITGDYFVFYAETTR